MIDLEEKVLSVKRYKNAPRAYIACAWFDINQQDFTKNVLIELSKNPSINYEESYKPFANQYEGEHREYLDESGELRPISFSSYEWQEKTYANDISALANSNVVVAIYDPQNSDTGIAYELGYARAMQKKVVLIRPDITLEEEQKDMAKQLNLMVALGVNTIITIPEIATYHFTNIKNNQFEGTVI